MHRGTEKIMNKLIFALAGATLTLAACSGGEADNAATNEPSSDELNQAASDAANEAEAAALGDQLNQLENTPATADATDNPSDEQEQNVAGM
jgi:hypothetical protein